MTTRRTLVRRVAAVGGVAAAYQCLRALRLVEGEDAWAGPPALSGGEGARVVILGAGMAGLAAAYELGRAGYVCKVLEARNRVGGRNWSIRRDDLVETLDGQRQVCEFSPGEYLNAGPARIPSHHDATLGYCREFSVPMETLVNYTGSAYIQSDRLNGAKPIRMRQAVHDARGHLGELLAKSIRGGGLDAVVSKEDADRLLEAAVQWGGLSPKGGAPANPSARSRGEGRLRPGDYVYAGTTSAGFATPPGAGGRLGRAVPPLAPDIVLDSFVMAVADLHEVINMQATMQQPVGGMDRLATAMAANLGPGVLQEGCEVKRISRTNSPSGKPGVEVTYLDRRRNVLRSETADYCICTIPLAVLAGVEADFSAEYRAAISKAAYDNAIKIAFEAPRFWETEAQIYGGLSVTERDTFVTWYPSHGFHTRSGVLVAGYSFNAMADRLGAAPAPQRIAYARETVERLHPGCSGLLRAPISVEWARIPYSRGITCPLDTQDPAAYALLGQPDGPFYFAGEHLSHVGAWQQGAIVSAHRAAVMLDARHRQGAKVAAVRPQRSGSAA